MDRSKLFRILSCTFTILQAFPETRRAFLENSERSMIWKRFPVKRIFVYSISHLMRFGKLLFTQEELPRVRKAREIYNESKNLFMKVRSDVRRWYFCRDMRINIIAIAYRIPGTSSVNRWGRRIVTRLLRFHWTGRPNRPAEKNGKNFRRSDIFFIILNIRVSAAEPFKYAWSLPGYAWCVAKPVI